jgi:hypothetical protein
MSSRRFQLRFERDNLHRLTLAKCAGAARYPSRQPVMANALEKPFTLSVRSRIPGKALQEGQWADFGISPGSYRVAGKASAHSAGCDIPKTAYATPCREAVVLCRRVDDVLVDLICKHQQPGDSLVKNSAYCKHLCGTRWVVEGTRVH